MSEYNKEPDTAGIAYGDAVYWLTIGGSVLALIGTLVTFFMPAEGFNPTAMFSAIMAGEPSAEIWAAGGSMAPSGHWYLANPVEGNSLSMLGVVISIIASVPAMLWTAVRLFRRGNSLFGSLAVMAAVSILAAAVS